MVGKSGSGEFAHAWALQLQEDVRRAGLIVALPAGTPEHGRRLVVALGARISLEPPDQRA